jgi:hypothetical protein
MFPLCWHYIKAFLFDENAAKRLLAGLGGLVGSMLVTLLAFQGEMLSWTPKQWLQHGLVALGGGLATMLPGPALAKPAEPKAAP